MPQLGVNAGTTFADIHARFQPTGGAADRKHLRFDNGNNLYTSQKASTAKLAAFFGSGDRLQARADKRRDGADQIRQAIARDHPAQAAAIFARLGQDHPHINLGQGVRRGDLDAIQDTINAVLDDGLSTAHLAATLPRVVALAPDAHDPSRLSGDGQGNFDPASRQATKDYMDGSLDDLGDAKKHKTVRQDGAPTVVEQFTKDVGRSEIRLGGTLLQGTEKDSRNACRELGRFAGGDDAAFHLSKMLTQQMTTALNVGVRQSLQSESGNNLMPRLGGPLDGNDKDQFINVTKQGDDFVVGYEVNSKLKGFSKGMTSLSTDEGASTVKLSMQVRISARDLADGNVGNYQVTQPPRYEIHAELDKASLLQQAIQQKDDL